MKYTFGVIITQKKKFTIRNKGGKSGKDFKIIMIFWGYLAKLLNS